MTPNYGVEPILKYIPKNAVVWCPFDKEDSEFVKQIRQSGHKVIATHIDNGENFYTYELQISEMRRYRRSQVMEKWKSFCWIRELH